MIDYENLIETNVNLIELYNKRTMERVSIKKLKEWLANDEDIQLQVEHDKLFIFDIRDDKYEYPYKKAIGKVISFDFNNLSAKIKINSFYRDKIENLNLITFLSFAFFTDELVLRKELKFVLV